MKVSEITIAIITSTFASAFAFNISPSFLTKKFGVTVNSSNVALKSTPEFPSSPFNHDPTANTGDNSDAAGNNDDDESTLKGSRFHKLAPDANLSTDEFRSQLRENMKADLEKRRREDPNRGNQPAKSYLDNL
mmetsp:Transcript_26863/g.37861  ORF Transcript_26863/g.37861 Transcript_26863/m.37861 type:complete len:133 (-) Transcript_26863:58-456(-)